MKAYKFNVGDRVFCTVHGARGWTTVLAVRPRDGYIRIPGFGPWCPTHNFTTDPDHYAVKAWGADWREE